MVACGCAMAHQLKGTRDNRLIPPRVHIDGGVWHLDVGSSHPGAGAGPRVRCSPIKENASWVQNVVRQFGPIRRARKKFEESCPSTRGPG